MSGFSTGPRRILQIPHPNPLPKFGARIKRQRSQLQRKAQRFRCLLFDSRFARASARLQKKVCRLRQTLNKHEDIKRESI